MFYQYMVRICEIKNLEDNFLKLNTSKINDYILSWKQIVTDILRTVKQISIFF